MQKEENRVPVWRRELDAYYVLNTTGCFVTKAARQFGITAERLRIVRDRIESVIGFGRNWEEEYHKLEAICVLLSEHISEREVLRLAMILFDNDIKTIGQIRAYSGSFQKIPRVGKLYDEILSEIRENNKLKEIHVRISYKAYLLLTESAKKYNMSISGIVERLIGEAPFL